MPHTVDLMPAAELASLPPPGCLGALATARGNLPLVALDVRAHVVGLAARIEVVQGFANPLAEPIEATYVFPLPDRAAVTRFRLRVGARLIEGVIQERAAARADYDAAVRAGQRAAIAEEDRPDVFTVRVGNLLPGEHAAVELELTGPLAVDDDEVTFRFPLVVAPRYIPGAPLEGESVGDGTALDTDAVPDASRISPPVLLPGQASPVRLALALELDPLGLPVGPLRSSLHAVVETAAGGRWRIALGAGERLDRDFVLRWTVGGAAVTSALAVSPDAEGDEATFALTVVPPPAHGVGRPRDLVFVLDRSGSMEGWKMVAARRAAARIIDGLTGRDRFAVLAFDDRIDEPAGLVGMVPATDRNRFRAVEFLATLASRGGTELAAPLARASRLLDDGEAGRDRVLVLCTDGQVGNEDQILASLGGELRGKRVFTLGIDQAVNAGFLKRLAAVGGGSCELLESEDRLDDAMERIHRRVAAPVATELSLRLDGAELVPGSVTPRRLPDLMAGSPLVIRGRLRRVGGAVRAVLSGQRRDGGNLSIEVDGKAATGADAAIWARGQLRELEDRHAIAPDDRLADEIVATSLRFQVLSRLTAFVAIDRSGAVTGGGAPHRLVQAVELPAGWASAPGAMPAAAPPARAMAAMPASYAMPMEAMLDEEAIDPMAAPKQASRSRGIMATLGGPRAPRAAAPLPPGGFAPRRRERAATPEPPLDLVAYRERLVAAVDEAAGADGGGRLALVGELELLAADLLTVDAPERVLEALAEVIRQLRAATDLPAGALDRLREIAGWLEAGPSTRPPGRRLAFWR
jgi:Ca-activated chloride channel homolog